MFQAEVNGTTYRVCFSYPLDPDGSGRHTGTVCRLLAPNPEYDEGSKDPAKKKWVPVAEVVLSLYFLDKFNKGVGRKVAFTRLLCPHNRGWVKNGKSQKCSLCGIDIVKVNFDEPMFNKEQRAIFWAEYNKIYS